MSDPISYAELGAVLARTQFGVSASDLHGSLAGFLCGGGHSDARRWLAALELDPDDSVTAAFPPHMLEQLYTDCAAWLADPGLQFEPLLPPTSAPLGARADALVEWCRGFLGGIGLAGAGAAGTLSAVAKEILSDFDTIAGTRFEYADSEEDENALAEVIEFIRVGALLLHTELSGTSPLPGTTLH
ncbi:MAG: UPF0149 family protein [Gammaproteobacteria bacterium]|nr:MAG: UPF0149 family protein [Gammaproteobacteria bacterium]